MLFRRQFSPNQPDTATLLDIHPHLRIDCGRLPAHRIQYSTS